MKKLLVALLASLFVSMPAFGAVSVNFSGGSGTPLSFTLLNPAQYTITTTNANSPFFVFDGTGGTFTLTGTTVSGSITYSINGGPAQTVNRLGSGRAANDVTADDSYLFTATLPGVTAGQVITLLAGTLTTTGNFAGTAPASGSFNTFIANQAGTRISAVPEPGAVALLVAGGALTVLASVVRRRSGR